MKFTNKLRALFGSDKNLISFLFCFLITFNTGYFNCRPAELITLIGGIMISSMVFTIKRLRDEKHTPDTQILAMAGLVLGWIIG